jgi:modification methylase
MLEVNKIYQIDVLKGLKQLEDNSVNLIVTSPPYNKHSAKRKCGKTDSWKKANVDYGDFKDDMPEEEYQEWQKKVLRECIRVLKPDGSIFYNHKPRIVNHKIIFPQEWLGEFNVRQMVIWNRKNSPTLEPIRFMPIVEYIFWITKQRKTPKFNKKAFHYKEIWEIPPKVEPNHPATFPEELVKRCIQATTDKGDLVLDCFIGSGTTAVACKQLNRNFIGIELSPAYCEIANKRIQQTQI